MISTLIAQNTTNDILFAAFLTVVQTVGLLAACWHKDRFGKGRE